MPERFSEDEARRIFARAAERQHAVREEPAGLSRAELEEIARAAGIDAAHVTAAIAEVRAGASDVPAAGMWGLDLSPRAVRHLPGPVTDEAWEQMVARLRRTFGTKGTPTDVGRVREWTGTNSQGGVSNLHAVLEPVEGGTRVTLETSRAKEAAQFRGLNAVMAVVSGLVMALLLLVGDGVPAAAVAFGAVPFLVSVLITTLSRRAYARWAAQRQREFDALLDQFELIARDASGPSEAAPRLDLDALADAPDAPDAAEAEAPASRRRARP